MRAFEIIEHTADIGFEAQGETLAELFRNSALAFMEIAAGVTAIEPRGEMAVVVTGHDYESLLVHWLEEILYLFDSATFAVRDFQVDEIDVGRLSARLLGEPRDPARVPWKVIVKAITYHRIEVVPRNGRWYSRVFVDI